MTSTTRAEPPQRFFQDALTLAGGGVIAQVIAVLTTPLLSRLYSVQDFGVFGVYAFLAGVPAVIACGCYEPAILLPKEDREARQVLALSLVIAATVGLLALLPILAAGSIAGALRAPQLAPWLGYLSLHLFALGTAQALSYWYNRVGQFRRLAVSRIVQTGATIAGQVAGAVVGLGVGGLVLGQVVGQVGIAGFLAVPAIRQRLVDRKVVTPEALAGVLTRYHKFPLYSSWGMLMSSAAFLVVPVLLSWDFGAREAGWYFFGYRLMSSAVVLASGSFGQVLYQRAASESHAGRPIGPLVRSVLVRVGGVAAVVFAAFMVFAPAVFAIVFGESWRMTGHYMRIVAPLFFIQLLTSPLSIVLFLREQQQIAAVMQLALLAGAVGSLTLSHVLAFEPTATLALYSATQSLVYLVYLLTILRYAGVGPLGVLADVLGTLRPGPRRAS